MANSFGALSTLEVDNQNDQLLPARRLDQAGLAVSRLPFSLKVLLENLLRHEDGVTVTTDDIKALASWDPKAEPDREIAFRPSRVLLQDFTGVPAIVDLAAMRDAMKRLGGDPKKINPLQPVELVIDHSVQVDRGRHAAGVSRSTPKWSSSATASATPSCAGARTPSRISASCRPTPASSTRSTSNTWPASSSRPSRRARQRAGLSRHAGRHRFAHDDDQRPGRAGLGRRRHRGRGRHAGPAGLDAGAAGRRLPAHRHAPRRGDRHRSGPHGHPDAAERKGVVGKFVEYYGPGLAGLPLADRATLANMAPEYGATCGLFPIDAETLRYLKLSGRPPGLIQLVEAYAKAQGIFATAGQRPRRNTRTRSSSTFRPSSPAWPAPGGRKTGSRCMTPRSAFRTALKELIAAAPAKTALGGLAAGRRAVCRRGRGYRGRSRRPGRARARRRPTLRSPTARS